MKEPEFDEDGYPTEETLKTLENWDFNKIREVMTFITKAWKYPERAREARPGLWVFSTGGWSGNESLMGAFQESHAWHMVAWDHIYLPGGLWIFALKGTPAEEELDRLFDYIRDWAWSKEIANA